MIRGRRATPPPKATSTRRRCAASSRRRTCTRATRALLDADADVFLHQSLSTPCFNALASCDGIWLTDVEGRRVMDFHGNNVHQVGYRPPARDGGGQAAARHAAVLAAAVHQRGGRRPRGEARGARTRPARQGAVRARRHARDRHGAEARPPRHRPAQDAVAVGQLPRRLARRDLDRRRSGVPQEHGAAAAGHRARAALRSRGVPLRLRRRVQRASAPSISTTCSARKRTSAR